MPFNTSIYKLISLLVIAVFITGCNQTVTQSGTSSVSGLISSVSNNVSEIGSKLNPFDKEARAFQKALLREDFVLARNLLEKDFKEIQKYNREHDYKNIEALSKFIWDKDYLDQYTLITQKLNAPISSNPSDWISESTLINQVDKFVRRTYSEKAFSLSPIKANNTQQLKSRLRQREKSYKGIRSEVLNASLKQALETKELPKNFPFNSFTQNDLINSDNFQKLILDKLNLSKDLDTFKKTALSYSQVLSSNSKAKVDAQFNDRVRKSLLQDGRISLDELISSTTNKLKTPFNTKYGDSIARVGSIDLTAEEFKNRALFDFPVGFNDDLKIHLSQAKSDLLNNRTAGYDFLFVTKLRASKVKREFRDSKTVGSKFQSGTQQVPNPEYPSAFANYQKAMTELQAYEMEQAIKKQSCYGTGNCIAVGLLQGLTKNLHRKSVDKAAKKLGNTPQFLTKPVYAPYQYKQSSVRVTKSADIDYYLIDLGTKRYYSNTFKFNEEKSFTVAYNVHDGDPDKTKIIGRVSNDNDISSYETKPYTVNLSALFDPKNLKGAKQKNFSDAERFLVAINDKVATAPSFASNKKTSTFNNVKADNRFDSVVVIRTGESLGTGFYVTPELILTAYHVVEGSNIVELQSFNGQTSSGRVVDHDLRLDLALIKSQETGVPVSIYDGAIQLGETVEAIGHPKGYEFTISRGVVSAVRKNPSSMIESSALVEYIQTDTPISPGNSGGPLFIGSRVVGVADWVRVDKASQNLNFSVSYNEVNEYLSRFVNK
jgi:S1-C subfamily serine protease